MKEFSIEYQFKKYLKMVKLNENKMPQKQFIETKRAF